MHYDMKNLSHDEAQIVGDILAKTCERIPRKIKRLEDNLVYQENHGRALNGLYILANENDWDTAAADTRKKLAYLRNRLADTKQIMTIIQVNE